MRQHITTDMPVYTYVDTLQPNYRNRSLPNVSKRDEQAPAT